MDIRIWSLKQFCRELGASLFKKNNSHLGRFSKVKIRTKEIRQSCFMEIYEGVCLIDGKVIHWIKIR